MSAIIKALDGALKVSGEDIILRRTGSPNVDVTCRARVDAVSTAEIVAGIPATDLNVIISPTEITAAGWPGTTAGAAPFNVDQRVPLINGPDKLILRGHPPRTISHAAPVFVNGELLRINLRVSGP